MAEKILAKERDEEKRKQEKLIQQMKWKHKMSSIIPFLGLVFSIIFFAVVTNGRTVNSSNLINLVNQSYTLIIVCVGAAFVYGYGGMDMSVGYVQGFISVIIAFVAMNHMVVSWLVLPIAILCGMLISSINGIVSVLTRVPVFVVSLCIMNICKGIVATAVADTDIYMPYSEYTWWNNNVLKAVVLVVIIVVGYYTFEYTRIGKNLKAMGGNITAARHSGINVTKYIILAYVIIGTTVGIVAFFTLTRTGVVTASTGSGLMLDVMTAIVLGGFPLFGGAKAKIASAVVGAVTVAVLDNGLTIWGLNPNYMNGVKGILFLVIVYISYERKKGEIFN